MMPNLVETRYPLEFAMSDVFNQELDGWEHSQHKQLSEMDYTALASRDLGLKL